MDDLISRAAALDVLVTSPNFHTTLTRIEELPAVDAVQVAQQWISVKDRMPDNDAICLVCGKKGGMRVARVFVGKTYSWWTIVGTGKYFNATHWMPLPEPPKMDGESDE